jgi:hypothetical protein
MASVNHILNDTNESMDVRLKKAVELINNPIDDESIPNCICWIGYRVLSGEIDIAVYKEYKDISYSVADAGLKARWLMSLSILDLYIDIFIGSLSEYKLKEVSLIWLNDNVKTLWPPQILNYLRSVTLYAYWLYLSGRKDECIHLCLNSIDQWRISTCSFNIADHPFRFTEMRDDFRCLQMLVFLLRACGYISFNDHYWMDLNIVNMYDKNEPFFYKALRLFEVINPEKALWKQQ